MKKLILLASLFIGLNAMAQNPVSWSFSSKKVNDKEYDVYITAKIDGGWHLYSQNQPKDAIAIPTSIKFNKNPLIDLQGPAKEVGKLEKYKDETLDISANQYSNTVSFVQRVKLKGKSKTNVTGKLEYQVCTNEKCLPPTTVNISVAL